MIKRLMMYVLFALQTNILVAESHQSQFEYVVTNGRWGKYMFVMAVRTGDERVPAPYGTAYEVESNGNLRRLWQLADWYELPHNVFLSGNGRILARLSEPAELDDERKFDQLAAEAALRFYSDGKVVKMYKISDVVEDISKGIGPRFMRNTFLVRTSGRSPRICLAEELLHERHQKLQLDPKTELFLLETREGNSFVFRLETGELLYKVKTVELKTIYEASPR